MKIISLLTTGLIGCVLVILQVTWFGFWPWLNVVVHLSLLFVIIVTIQADWRSGVPLALFLGVLYQLFSPLPGWIHPISFALAAGGTWVIRRRLVTSRTGTSVVISVIGGTVVYYLAATSLILAAKIFNGATLTPVWTMWLRAGAWQLAIHPALAGVWWVTTRQRQAVLHV